MLTSLSLDKEMVFITDNDFSPVFLSPVLVFQSPFLTFYFHSFGKELFFHGPIGFPANFQEAPANS